MKDEIRDEILNELDSRNDFEPDQRHEWGVPETLDSGGDAGLSEAWDIVFDGNEASLTECVSFRAGKTEVLGSDGVLTHTMTGSGTVYIAEKYNSVTGASEIIEGTSKAAVVETGTPSDTEIYEYRLLYKCIKNGDCWDVLCDYRNIPVRGMYG